MPVGEREWRPVCTACSVVDYANPKLVLIPSLSLPMHGVCIVGSKLAVLVVAKAVQHTSYRRTMRQACCCASAPSSTGAASRAIWGHMRAMPLHLSAQSC